MKKVNMYLNESKEVVGEIKHHTKHVETFSASSVT